MVEGDEGNMRTCNVRVYRLSHNMGRLPGQISCPAWQTENTHGKDGGLSGGVKRIGMKRITRNIEQRR